MMLRLALFVTLLPAAAATGQVTLQFDPPADWIAQPTRSSMRVAEFVLPKADGDAEDASLIIYYFGGSGGSVEANLDRWLGQMVQPDGRPSQAVATTTTLTANGLPITLLDVTGTYVAEITPGQGERHNKPGFHLRAAVVETPAGPYFVKLTGPARTVKRWDASFTAFLRSLRAG